MKKQILLGMALGALLLSVIAAVIDSRSMNSDQFNTTGNRLSIKDGVKLTNQQTGVIKDDAGVTRIIQIAGGSSGFNDGFGVNRVQIDAGGVIKLKATNAAQLFQLTGDGYGEASFPWTFDNGILVGGNTNNSVWLFNPKNGLYRNFLFTDANGDTQVDPDNDLHINSANNFIDGSLDLLGPVHITNAATFYGGIYSSGTGGSLISQTASNGFGVVNIRPDFTMANTQTVVWPTNLPAVGQHLGVKATNWYGTTNLEIQTDWETSAGSNLNTGGFNVLNAGAVGDGVTDDTTAFQNCLNSNKNVYVPGGFPGTAARTYSVRPLRLTNNVLHGDGDYSSILVLRAAANGDVLIGATNGANQIYGLGIYGTNAVNYQAGFSPQCEGVQFNCQGQGFVEHCTVAGFMYGFHLYGTNNLTRPNLSHIDYNVISNCYNPMWCMQVNQAEYIGVRNNRFMWGKNGIYNETSANLLLVGNIVTDMGSQGYQEVPNSSSGRGHSRIEANIFNHTGGVLLQNITTGVGFTGNQMQGSGQITITNCNGVVFDGNHLELKTSPAIIVGGTSTNNWIKRCVLSSGSTVSNIVGDAGNNLIVRDNDMMGIGDPWESLSISANFTNSCVYQTILITATTVTNTLPSPVGIKGLKFTVKLTASGTAAVRSVAGNIEGTSEYELTAQNKYATFLSDGSNYQVISNN